MLLTLLFTACWQPDSPQQPEVPLWSLRPVLTIGAVDGPNALNDVLAVVQDPSGEILVTQWNVPAVAVFSPDGWFQREIGRGGQGPGEFVAPGGLGFIGDTLWVADRWALLLFDVEGRHLGRIQTAAARIDEMVGPTMPLADGTILGYTQFSTRSTWHYVLRLSRGGEVLDTLAQLPLQNALANVRFADGGSIVMFSPFPGALLWGSFKNGTGIATLTYGASEADPSYVLTTMSLEGDTVLAQSYQYTPEPVTQTWVDSIFRDLALTIATHRSLSVESIMRSMREQIDAPAYHRPVTRLLTGDDGTIWLRGSDARSDSVEWQILSEEAKLIGRLRTPIGAEVKRAGREAVWLVTRDELDVPYLMKNQIVRD